MARSRETVGKKEKQKRKARKKQDKLERKEERRANNDKGKSLEEMMVYLDEHGNLTDTPPDPKKKIEIKTDDILLGAATLINEPYETERKGVVTFFNESKGYGFINDLKSQENIFVHINNLQEPVREKDKVVFETERGPRGLSAIKVRKA